MINLLNVRNELESAMCSDDPVRAYEFVMKHVPDILNEIEQLRNEKNLAEIALVDVELKLKEYEDDNT